MPIVGNVFLLPVIVVTVLPIPDYPLSLTPFIFLAMMLIGFVVMKVVETRRPDAMAGLVPPRLLIRDIESSAKPRELP